MERRGSGFWWSKNRNLKQRQLDKIYFAYFFFFLFHVFTFLMHAAFRNDSIFNRGEFQILGHWYKLRKGLWLWASVLFVIITVGKGFPGVPRLVQSIKILPYKWDISLCATSQSPTARYTCNRQHLGKFLSMSSKKEIGESFWTAGAKLCFQKARGTRESSPWISISSAAQQARGALHPPHFHLVPGSIRALPDIYLLHKAPHFKPQDFQNVEQPQLPLRSLKVVASSHVGKFEGFQFPHLNISCGVQYQLQVSNTYNRSQRKWACLLLTNTSWKGENIQK